MLKTSQKPFYHCHAFLVSPMIREPMAEPRLPLPSITPATVHKAFGLLARAFYLPRSAAQDALIILQIPDMKNPKKNIKAYKALPKFL